MTLQTFNPVQSVAIRIMKSRFFSAITAMSHPTHTALASMTYLRVPGTAIDVKNRALGLLPVHLQDFREDEVVVQGLNSGDYKTEIR